LLTFSSQSTLGGGRTGDNVGGVLATQLPRAGTEDIPFSSGEGDPIAELTIPSLDDEAVLVVRELPSRLLPTNSEAVTPAIDVVVMSPQGEVTQFSSDPVTLCFFNVDTTDNRCLGFINDEGDWECEDYCLTGSGGTVCGDSDHLTSFAILLDTEGGSDSRCGSSSLDLRLVWASSALVICAVVMVLLVVAAYEVHLRRTVMADNTRLTRTVVESPGATDAAAAADAAAESAAGPFYN
jgi:hypothetical protein